MQNSDVQLQHHATTTLGPSQAVKYSAAVTSNAMTCTCSGSSVKPEARQAWWGLLSWFCGGKILLTDELKVSRDFPFGLAHRLESIAKSVGCHHPPRESNPFKSSAAPDLFPPAPHPSSPTSLYRLFISLHQPCLSDLGPPSPNPLPNLPTQSQRPEKTISTHFHCFLVEYGPEH